MSRPMTMRRVVVALVVGLVALSVAAVFSWDRRSSEISQPSRVVEDQPTDESDARRIGAASPEEALDDDALEQRLARLRSHEAELQTELEELRAAGETREHFVERCARQAGKGCPVAHPPRDVLEARARCGTIVWDEAGTPQYPPELRDELGITESESEVLRRVATEVEADAKQAMDDNWRRATGEDPPNGDFPSPMAVLEIELGRRFPDERAVERLAKELAGLEARLTSYEDRSPYYWHLRTRFESGDRFEEALAAELGETRARELRMAMGGWGGTTMYSAALCPEED